VFLPVRDRGRCEVEFALDGKSFFDEEALHDAAFGAGLVSDESAAEDGVGCYAGFGGVLDYLDASAFTASTGVDLALTTTVPRVFVRLIPHPVRCEPLRPGHWYAVARKAGLWPGIRGSSCGCVERKFQYSADGPKRGMLNGLVPKGDEPMRGETLALSRNHARMDGMPRVRLYHWKAEEATPLVAKLRAAGYEVVHKPEARTSTRELKESGAVAVVIDLSRMPSHGKYVGAWLRGSKSTRHIPLVFCGRRGGEGRGDQKQLPDAVYASVAGIGGSSEEGDCKSAARTDCAAADEWNPRPGRTAAQKMGIREGNLVGLIDPPADYLKVIGELPEGVVLEEDSRQACPITIWFRARSWRVRGGAAIAAEPGRAKPVVDRVAKKGRRDGLNGNFVRNERWQWDWWITRFVRSTECGAEWCSRLRRRAGRAAKRTLRPHDSAKARLLGYSDDAEQAVGIVIWSCSEEEFVGGAVRTGSLAEIQSQS